jgi:(S)-ureidoglycine aminohydrolase
VTPSYYAPHGGHPDQQELLTDRAMFTESYAVIPRGTMRDIVTSYLPNWTGTRLWVLARPLSGFAETFSQYIVEGRLTITIDGDEHQLDTGGYAYLPPSSNWTARNAGQDAARFHWIRKAYVRVQGLDVPTAFVTNEADVEPVPMPGTDGAWVTSRFVDPQDLRHDMHVNIVTFRPGAVIPFAETHVMEHGLYVLEGKAVYRLNQDWVEVQAGDFMWLRAFCPQACYAGGPGLFRYLLYKDVNRHAHLSRQFG